MKKNNVISGHPVFKINVLRLASVYIYFNLKCFFLQSFRKDRVILNFLLGKKKNSSGERETLMIREKLWASFAAVNDFCQRTGGCFPSFSSLPLPFFF